jgi:hypothetical protein
MIATYDPLSVIVLYAGIPAIGVAKGTFVKIERNEDVWKTYIGCMGEVARAHVRDITGKITVTLMHTSPTNELWSGVQQLDENTGLFPAPAMVKDMFGSTLFMSDRAWIQKPAHVEYGEEVTTREWIIYCAALRGTVGSSISV